MHANTIQHSTVQCSAVQCSAVSFMQVGVTCTSFLLTTQLKSDDQKKKNHDLAPKLAAYTLMRSFSHMSHQCSHDSIVVYAVMGGPQCYDHVDPHLKNLCDGVLSGQLACACA